MIIKGKKESPIETKKKTNKPVAVPLMLAATELHRYSFQWVDSINSVHVGELYLTYHLTTCSLIRRFYLLKSVKSLTQKGD
jgi:hypothetical protein